MMRVFLEFLKARFPLARRGVRLTRKANQLFDSVWNLLLVQDLFVYNNPVALLLVGPFYTIFLRNFRRKQSTRVLQMAACITESREAVRLQLVLRDKTKQHEK
jgi:hypothetical protein